MSERAVKWANAKIFLAALIFSTSGLTSKWMPWGALTLVGMRALVAVVEMAIVRRSVKVTLNRPTVVAALCVSITSLLFIFANKNTTAANAIVLQYAMPVFVILACWIFFKQRPTGLDLLTAALVLLGVTLCFVDSIGGGNVLGDMLALASAVTYSMVFLSSRVPGCDPYEYTFLGNLFSCAFAINVFFDPNVRFDEPTPWLVLLVMGVCLSTGYLLFSSGMKHTSPVTAAILCNIEPVMNPIWVFWALRERPGAPAIIGACVVLLSITGYSILKQRRTEPKPGLANDA